jgi:hypothetical protein
MNRLGRWAAEQRFRCPFCHGTCELGELDGGPGLAVTHSLPACDAYLTLDGAAYLEAITERRKPTTALQEARRLLEQHYDETCRIISAACFDWLSKRPGALLVFVPPRQLQCRTATPEILELMAASPDTLELLTHLQERAGGRATVFQIVTLMECLERKLAACGRVRKLN